MNIVDYINYHPAKLLEKAIILEIKTNKIRQDLYLLEIICFKNLDKEYLDKIVYGFVECTTISSTKNKKQTFSGYYMGHIYRDDELVLFFNECELGD